MLIVTIRSGQLCNRLFQFAHFIAFCKHRNLRIVNLAFADYAELFTSTDERLLISFPSSGYRLRNKFIRTNLQRAFRILGFLFSHLMPRFLGIASIDFNEEITNAVERLESVLGYRLVFVDGWYFRDPDDFKRYTDDIRNYFIPKEIFMCRAKEIHSQIRQDSDVVIGLHIRRKDYKNWEDGRYYFEDVVYVRIIQELITQFPGKNVKILVASDEPLKLENYAPVRSKIVWDRRESMVDLIALAQCDYIVGPPSTFSAWASFYGKVPMFIIRDPQQPIDFKKASTFGS